jgi:hypothetical protein
MESEFNYAGQTGGIGTPSPSSQSLIDQSQKGLSNPFTEIRKLYDRLTKSKAKPQI